MPISTYVRPNIHEHGSKILGVNNLIGPIQANVTLITKLEIVCLALITS
jgi:hypothetical protein